MRPLAGTEHLRGVKVLILTTFESDGSLFATLRGGASGFLVKDSGPTEVLNAVRVVASGEALLSPAATRRLIEEFAAWPERGRSAPEQLDELTDREREVMALVAYGLTNREIAERLLVSPATAKTHVSRAMGKLHAHDRAQLVVLAYQTALVSASGAGAIRAARQDRWPRRAKRRSPGGPEPCVEHLRPPSSRPLWRSRRRPHRADRG